MVSMQDIADRVGVTKSTVSLVLNGKSKGRVSAAVRQKILQEAESCNFHMNEVARTLRTGKSRVICVLVTDISNEFFGKLTFHIQEEAKKSGYMVLIANTNENDAEMDDAVTTVINRQVDGVIAVPTADCESSLRRLMDAGIPLVQVDRYYPGIDAPYVGVSNYGAASKAVRSLLDRGSRKIGLVSYDFPVTALQERCRGYADTLREASLYDESLIHMVGYENQEAQVDRAVADLQKECDAIFFTSRRVFTLGIKALSKEKVRPRLLCFDEVRSYQAVFDGIHSVEQPVETMGVAAFRLLLEAIDGNPARGQFIYETTGI